MATATKTRSDIFSRLEQDHEEIKRMFEQLTSGQGKRQQLFLKLQSELEAHTKAEERTFYKAIQSNERTHELVLEGVEEHHVASLLLRELAANTPESERWLAKAKVLKEVVEHHIEEEEGEMFQKAGQVLAGDRAMELTAAFEAEKKQLQKKR